MQIKANYEAQLPINSMLNDEIEKKIESKTRTQENDLSKQKQGLSKF